MKWKAVAVICLTTCEVAVSSSLIDILLFCHVCFVTGQLRA